MKPKINISFLGAAGTVTGSKYLVSTGKKKILIDCGLFQGLKKWRLLNWGHFPIDPKKIDLVLLTHGHLDHVGYLPKLVKQGFFGPVWGTSPTLDVTKIILLDSARIQEEDAERANKKKFSKHSPAIPLYNVHDAEQTLSLFKPKPADKWIEIDKDIFCRFRYNSHILGATFLELKIGKKIIVFSGDIGRANDPLLFPPKKPTEADVLLIESTYGDRLHPDHHEEKFADAIRTAIQRKGTIIIPSFAVERTQAIMHFLSKFKKKKHIPAVPVYIDSPMGENVFELFRRHRAWHKLEPAELAGMESEIKQVKTITETYHLLFDNRPKIIIAGSGMVTGGRVMLYLQKYLQEKNATIFLIGYQAEGTRGRQLLNGATEIKLDGRYYPVKAKIENFQGLSAHADQKGLLNWLGDLKTKPKRIFIVHGEPAAADALRVKIKDSYNWECEIPELNYQSDL